MPTDITATPFSNSILPIIEIAGSSSRGGGASPIDRIGSIGESYRNLADSSLNIAQQTGAGVLHLDAGELSLASSAQIGRIVDGTVITKEIVASNQDVINKISRYAHDNHLSVTVEAQLDNPSTGDWTYQWLYPAIIAGLPIGAVEGDNEIALQHPMSDFAKLAQQQVAIVAQIARYYPNVKVGQWEGGNPIAESVTWWSAYDSAAQAAGLPQISYVVADTGWNSPWVTAAEAWEKQLQDVSQATHALGKQLHVKLDGVSTDGSGLQWTAQTEQHAAMLAQTSNITVDQFLFKSWEPVYPESLSPTTSPTTLASAVIAVASTYSLYQAGTITADGPLTLTTAAQAIVASNGLAVLPNITFVSGADQSALLGSVAVVITDQAGLLSIREPNGVIVSGTGTTRLVVSGMCADVQAALSGVQIFEPQGGLDFVHVELFGKIGRLSDVQLAVTALSSTEQDGSYEFLPMIPAQSWTSATAQISSHIVTSETFYWTETGGTDEPSVLSLETVAYHSPLQEPGLVSKFGSFINPKANPTPNSPASLPIGMSHWNSSAYNPTSDVSIAAITERTISFDQKGRMVSVTERLSPRPTVETDVLNGIKNKMDTGGSRVTIFNTGVNTLWDARWDTSIASETSVLDSNNHVVEQSFQGIFGNPNLTLQNVYNPDNGVLWEQFETTAPPSDYHNFVTGDRFITLFNTGDNPNWDYEDWGDADHVTLVGEDYYIKTVTRDPLVPTGLFMTNAYRSPGASINSTEASKVGDDVEGSAGNSSHSGGNGAEPPALTGTGLLGSVIDLLSGGQILDCHGNDTVNAGVGPDTIFASGPSISVNGGSGLLLLVGGTGSITLNGGAGSYTVFGGEGGGAISGGRGGRNVLVAGGGNATLVGGGTGDMLVAGSGTNTLVMHEAGIAFGGVGHSTIFGAAGGTIVGGSGSDVMLAGNGAEALWAGTGTSELHGGSGDDTLVGGVSGQATIIGGGGNNLIVGVGGKTLVRAGKGGDTIFSGAGQMEVTAGGGDVTMVFGSGLTSMTSGTGTGHYLFFCGAAGGSDVISGFKVGTDQLQLFGYDHSRVGVSASGGDTKIALEDGTRITLLGITNLAGDSIV